ncbi:hypothetical protein NKH18_32495 [Streptomyces sp. M10(2022)]
MKTSALGRIALACGVAALAAGAVPATAHADEATGERKTLPVMVEFSDSGFEHPDQVKAGTPDTYFGTGKDSLASFLSEVSRGSSPRCPPSGRRWSARSCCRWPPPATTARSTPLPRKRWPSRAWCGARTTTACR